MTPSTSSAAPWLTDHPFISFELNLGKLAARTWVLLGECSSKIDHISNVPLKPDALTRMLSIYLVKGVHGTTAIEGNTLSEDQVKRRLDKKLELPASQAYLGQEVDNIVNAYNLLIQRLEVGAPLQLTPEDLKGLNKMVLEGLDVADDVVPGEFRSHRVVVNDYRSPDPRFTPALLGRLCDWLNHAQWDEELGCPYVKPILKAIVAHLYIAWVHPFGDGNGRTARLIEFDILTRAGVPITSAHVLSDHYNKTRGAYYRALSNARRDPCDFVQYAVQGFVDGIREQLQWIWEQQTLVTWTNYVHEQFHGSASVSAHRRRDLAIALATLPEAIDARAVPTVLPQFAVWYTSERMLQRDINVLHDRRLVVRDRRGKIAPNLGLLREMLPFRNDRPTAVDRSKREA